MINTALMGLLCTRLQARFCRGHYLICSGHYPKDKSIAALRRM